MMNATVHLHHVEWHGADELGMRNELRGVGPVGSVGALPPAPKPAAPPAPKPAAPPAANTPTSESHDEPVGEDGGTAALANPPAKPHKPDKADKSDKADKAHNPDKPGAAEQPERHGVGGLPQVAPVEDDVERLRATTEHAALTAPARTEHESEHDNGIFARVSRAAKSTAHWTVEHRHAIGTAMSVAGSIAMATGVGAPIGGALVAGGAAINLSQDLPELVHSPRSGAAWLNVGLDSVGAVAGGSAATAPLRAAADTVTAANGAGTVVRAGAAVNRVTTAILTNPVVVNTATAGGAVGLTAQGADIAHKVVTGNFDWKTDGVNAAATGAMLLAGHVGARRAANAQTPAQAEQSLASDLHEKWRAERLQPDGSFEPRIKATKDVAWAKANGTDQVDIANTTFSDLPNDWKQENLASARSAISTVVDAGRTGRAFSPTFKTRAASDVHDAWLSRNGAWAPASQQVPYADLGKLDKKLDMNVVELAMQHLGMAG